MEEICQFEINNRIYTIYNIDKIPGKESYIGRSNYDDRNIYIEYGSKDEMLLTLKHELTHVWLHENGYENQDNGCFSFEQVCEIVAYSNNSINRITKLYLENL